MTVQMAQQINLQLINLIHSGGFHIIICGVIKQDGSEVGQIKFLLFHVTVCTF